MRGETFACEEKAATPRRKTALRGCDSTRSDAHIHACIATHTGHRQRYAHGAQLKR